MTAIRAKKVPITCPSLFQS